MIIHVKVGKDKRDLDVAHNATLSQVASLVTNTFDGDLSVSSLTLLFKGRAFKPGQSKQDADTILHNAGVNTSAAKRSKSHVLLCCGNSPTAGCDIRRSLKPGIRAGATLMALGNSNKVVQQAIDSSTDDPLMRGIEEELALIARRRRPARNARTVVTGKYTFQKYRALPEHELEGAYPAPQKALEFLHRLAADPGIVGIMQQHQFTVGCLSEMPPQDFMDDTRSVTCLLGLNINAGQEIKLRLRTNDLKGFRNYERIRETLVHELAHNVWRDHDNNFKELNSKLLRECVRINRVRASAQTLIGDAEVREEVAVQPQPAAAAPASHVLGGGRGKMVSAGQAAAAAAALRQTALGADRDTSVACSQAGGREGVDVARAYEQVPDSETRAEEKALAAWGSPSAARSSCDAKQPEAGPQSCAGSPPAAGEPAVSMAFPDVPAIDRGDCRDDAMAVDLPGAAEEAGAGSSSHAAGAADADGDAHMHGVEDSGQMPSEVVRELVQSIAAGLRRQHGGGAVVALQTVQRILRNAAEKAEPKYRRIKRHNEMFAVRVAQFPEAEALLTVAGFRLQDDVWTLPPQHSTNTLVRVHAEVAQVLQSCQ